ncbi:PREDICTED: kynurenine formamidase-like, partial [Nicrophorus vespilloides]|uniref:Kynurenine formamidase-like n=1 Tax=Nicrophorus vespilloides TaxID=110193 RepID=A0ABM1N9T2_NICVS
MASEMDVLYAPSRWSKRLNTDEVVKKHVEIVTEASHKAKKNVPCMLNQRYGDGPNEKVDIFGTDLPG